MTETTELTREAILAMPAGREMDELIALRVMGWHCVTIIDAKPPYCFYEHPIEGEASLPFYSTDIAAAWDVVEKLRARWGNVIISTANVGWEVSDSSDEFLTENCASAETLSLAICRAALISTL